MLIKPRFYLQVSWDIFYPNFINVCYSFVYPPSPRSPRLLNKGGTGLLKFHLFQGDLGGLHHV